LGGTYSDLTFTVVLDVPTSSATYRLDKLRFTCKTPTAGMTVKSNTTLCSGTYALNVAAGAAAVNVTASNVTLACKGTVIQGSGPMGPTGNPNVGFRANGVSNVTIKGCTAKTFTYGASANSSSNLTLDSDHFDDNFTDATQGWVNDSVQGGGVRLEN